MIGKFRCFLNNRRSAVPMIGKFRWSFINRRMSYRMFFKIIGFNKQKMFLHSDDFDLFSIVLPHGPVEQQYKIISLQSAKCLIKNDLIKLYIRRVVPALNPNPVTMTFWQLWTLSMQALQAWSLAVGVYTEAEFSILWRERMWRSWLRFSSTTANNKDNGHGKKVDFVGSVQLWNAKRNDK